MLPSAKFEKSCKLVAIIIMAIWLVALGWVSYRYHIPTSPDEAANRLMAQSLADRGSLRYATPLTPAQLAVYQPRSLTAQGSDLLPGSFIGFVLIQGWLMKISTLGPIIFGVILWALALMAWYRIGRRYWSWPWAMASSIMVASIPVVIAHQILPLTQPAMYLGFLLLTGWAMLRYEEHQTIKTATTVGLLLGLTLFVRPVEVLFIGPIAAVVMLAKKKYKLFFLAVITALIVQLPWMLVARSLYGGLIGSGYGTFDLAVSANAGHQSILNALFIPAGGQWSWYFLTAAKDYLLLLYPAMSAMSIIALVIYLRRKFVQPVKIIKIGLVIIFGLYYLAYYGSWNLYPDVIASRIGSAASYARYWLSLYVGMCAGVIVFLRWLTNRKFKVAAVIIGLMVFVNLVVTWAHPSAGLKTRIAANRAEAKLVQQVLNRTAENSLILAGIHDKSLLGERLAVNHYPVNQSDWQLLKPTVATQPTYIVAGDLDFRSASLIKAAQQIGIDMTKQASFSGVNLWKLSLITPTS